MRDLIKVILLISIFIIVGCNKEILPSMTKGISIGGSSSKDVSNNSSTKVKKMALIIGISDYAPATKNDLDGIERDTSKMKRLFESWGFEVTTLYDSQAMKIVDYLEDYAKKLNKNDYFAFYYSGHGSFKTDENGDETDNRDETLVLSDGTTNKHLLDDTLYAEFNKIKAKKLIFLDSCHSGTAFRAINNNRVKAKSISPDDVTDTFPTPINTRGISIGGSSKEIISGNDYIVFSAAQDNEESLATPTGSLFTNAIYQTFTDKKYLDKPLKDIKSILTENVIEYAKKTASTPHHPNISVSNLELESKSLNSFINDKLSSPTVSNNNYQNKTQSSTNSLEDTLNDMINSGKFKKMSIDYQKTSYNIGEAVKFTIDTKGDRGFLTIFYIDGNDVTLLYPNGFILPKEINGRYRFPDDLANGKFELEAYKSCKGCSEEKTVIYTLLSAEQITDIGKIKRGDLISFPKNSEASQIMSRAVKIKAVPQTKTEFKPQLGKYEFIVK
jgi:hypothetical protein